MRQCPGVPQLAEGVAWQLNPFYSRRHFSCFKAVLSFLGSCGRVAETMLLQSRATGFSLFPVCRWIGIPFGHSTVFWVRRRNRVRAELRCCRLAAPVLSWDRWGILVPSGLPSSPWTASIPACLTCLKRVNTSTMCHSEITTGTERFPRINKKVWHCGRVLPSSCRVIGVH